MAISATATTNTTLYMVYANRIIQTATLNGLSFDFVLFCWVFFLSPGRHGEVTFILTFSKTILFAQVIALGCKCRL